MKVSHFFFYLKHLFFSYFRQREHWLSTRHFLDIYLFLTFIRISGFCFWNLYTITRRGINVGIGSPPLSTQRMSPPLDPKWGSNTLLRVRGYTKSSPNPRKVFKRIRRIRRKNLCVHGEDAKRLLTYSPNTPKEIKVCLSRLIIIQI